MGELAGRMQVRLKKTSTDMANFCLKLVSGTLLGLTFALVAQEALGKRDGENVISFTFMIVAIAGAFLRVSKKWSVASVLIFDLICVLIGMVLRLYVMVAPGA